MTARARLVLLGAIVDAASGCGQTGPLVMPESARPIERIDPATQPEQTDDEQQDER